MLGQQFPVSDVQIFFKQIGCILGTIQGAFFFANSPKVEEDGVLVCRSSDAEVSPNLHVMYLVLLFIVPPPSPC